MYNTPVPAIRVEPLTDELRSWAEGQIRDNWGDAVVITRGARHEPAKLPGFVAFKDSLPVGLATYRIDGRQCELITLHAISQWSGIGSELISHVEAAARNAGCSRVWLITTNDNVDALRFYQRRGYMLAAVHPNALQHSRLLKPSIPLIGKYGIPLRDEIELERFI